MSAHRAVREPPFVTPTVVPTQRVHAGGEALRALATKVARCEAAHKLARDARRRAFVVLDEAAHAEEVACAVWLSACDEYRDAQ